MVEIELSEINLEHWNNTKTKPPKKEGTYRCLYRSEHPKYYESMFLDYVETYNKKFQWKEHNSLSLACYYKEDPLYWQEVESENY